MKKILFLIHDLGVGGAEKVLVNLVNNMDRTHFNITVIALFGGGVNEQFLAPHVRYRAIWTKAIPGNSKLMLLMTPSQLHRLCIKESYDVEIAYLEGPAARVISGCSDPKTKLLCWIHVEQHNRTRAVGSFRSYRESKQCYERFEQIVCVSETVRKDFLSIYPGIRNTIICYNTIETNKILDMKEEPVEDVSFSQDEFKVIAVGKISRRKGFDRLARIITRLREDGLPVHLYALGVGPDREKIEEYLKKNHIQNHYTFLGYQTNPYKYMSKCDLFVCASLAEGFSTAATEALIVGTPICTVDVSGMKEMLGDNNEWGVVTDNNDESLYMAIRQMVNNRELLLHYRRRAEARGEFFSTENTVSAVERLLNDICK